MKDLMERVGKRSFLPVCALASTLAVSALASPSPVYTMTYGNSAATFDGSAGGLTSWNVNNQSQLGLQTFYVRSGSGGIVPLSSLATPTLSPAGRYLTAVYNTPTFSFQIDYALAGAGSSSDIGETITIQNNGANPLSLSIFQYADFNLGGQQLNDKASLSWDSSSAKWIQASQQKQNGPFVTTAGTSANSVITPEADAAEIDFAGPNGTLSRLVGNYNLDPNKTSPLTGDVTWALQWNFNVAAGDAAIISEDNRLSNVLVPEPSAFALVSMGLAGWLVQRRRLAKVA